METHVLNERLRFVTDYESGQWSMTELCERYEISREAGYEVLGFSGTAFLRLEQRSRAPLHHRIRRRSWRKC